jgi:cytochrome c biogenesis protein CcdA
MFRRLRGYLARNRGRYLLGALLLLGYDAGIVVVPLLVGWSIQAVADSLPAAEVGRALPSSPR